MELLIIPIFLLVKLIGLLAMPILVLLLAGTPGLLIWLLLSGGGGNHHHHDC